MVTKAKFVKGQIVYQACLNFSTITKTETNGSELMFGIRLGAVIERQIDSCGKKKATFFNRGDNDSIFGRSVSMEFEPNIFATKEEAFAALEESKRTDVICPDVYSDENRQCFRDLDNSVMRIAAKTK